jgi:plasmid stabilization system protein ParE
VSLQIVFRTEARLEFDEAFNWYETQGKGLGLAFVSAVQRSLDIISANPLAYATVTSDVRKAVMRRFPYCIFYRPLLNCVEVIAVFHSSRDPSVWHRRA